MVLKKGHLILAVIEYFIEAILCLLNYMFVPMLVREGLHRVPMLVLISGQAWHTNGQIAADFELRRYARFVRRYCDALALLARLQ